MPSYIERDALYEKTANWESLAFQRVEQSVRDGDLTEWRKWSAVLAERSAFKFDVADAPAADVQPVIYCKDRKHYKLSEYNSVGIHVCKKRGGVVGDHDFCSRAEKADKEDG